MDGDRFRKIKDIEKMRTGRKRCQIDKKRMNEINVTIHKNIKRLLKGL